MKRVTLSVLMFLLSMAALAVDAVWNNASTTAQCWTDAANWVSATGEELPLSPTNAADNVTLPYLDDVVRKINLFPDPAGASAQWSLASVSGDRHYELVLSKGNYTFGHRRNSVAVGDVNGFDGRWSSVSARSPLRLTAAVGEQRLASVEPKYQFPIEVVNAGVTATVERLVGTQGTLVKSGDGVLRIGDVYDAPLSLQIDKGEVVIEGVIAADDPVFQKAAVHFDASRADTLLGFTDDKGRYRVTNWLNRVSSSANHASVFDNTADKTESHVKLIGVPMLTANASATGLAMIDFGTVEGNTKTPDEELLPTDEPVNCAMKFARLKNVREVFAVFDHDGLQAKASTPVLGDGSDYSLGCNEYYAINKSAGSYAAIKQGEIIFNNRQYAQKPNVNGEVAWPKDVYSPQWSNLALMEVKSAGDLCFGYLATDRLYKGSTGGIRIGEVLLFTNELTGAERKDISRHLMKKWFGEYPQEEFKLVHAVDGAAITVPAGRTVKLGTVCAQGGIVKKGEGTLEISRLYPVDAAFRVEGGKVKFAQSGCEVSADAPAGTPQFWYDADREDAFEIVDGNVVGWYDCREEYRTARKASKLGHTQITALPTVDDGAIAGRKVLDFPPKAAFAMPSRIGNAYSFNGEALMVFTFTTAAAAKSYNHICGGSYSTDRDTYKFFNPSVADDVIGGEVCTIDGIPVDPVAADDGTTFEPGRWYVVSAAYSAGIGAVYIGSNAARGKTGCIKVGEIITYASRLTESERRDTVAYLMKKWLGKEHPDCVLKASPSLDCASANPVTIGADGDIDYNSVSGGDGTLVKTGGGSSTVFADLTDDFETLTVDGGELTVSKAGYQDKSAFHFDASASESLTTYVTDEGAGVLQTNVSLWSDVRANGITAAKPGINSYLNFTNPVLTQVEMRPGVFRPALDFLEYFGRSDANKELTYLPGAGFHISKEFKNIVEAHVIFADRRTDKSMPVFTAKNEVQFNRGGSKRLFATDADATGTKSSQYVQNGYIALDNVPATPSTSLPAGFHLVSIVPTAGMEVNTIAAERSNTGGSSLQAELIGFTEAQSEAERGYLQAHLMHKWFGAEKPVWTNESPLKVVSVAAGSTLNITGEATLKVPKLIGSGTVSASALADVAEITLDTEANLPVAKTIAGDIGFADRVTVRFAGGFKPAVGEYELIKVGGDIFNFKADSWTVAGDFSARHRVSVKVSEGVIVLSVTRAAMFMIVR